MNIARLRRSWLAAVLVIGGPGYNAVGAAVPVPDSSFEISTNVPGSFVAGTGTNWAGTGNGGLRLQNFNPSLFAGTDTLPPPADGTNCLVEIINGHPAFCWQDIGRLQSNTVYTLTIAVGQTFTEGTGVGRIALINGTSPFQTVLAQAPVDSSLVTPGAFSDVTLVYTSGYHAIPILPSAPGWFFKLRVP